MSWSPTVIKDTTKYWEKPINLEKESFIIDDDIIEEIQTINYQNIVEPIPVPQIIDTTNSILYDYIDIINTNEFITHTTSSTNLWCDIPFKTQLILNVPDSYTSDIKSFYDSNFCFYFVQDDDIIISDNLNYKIEKMINYKKVDDKFDTLYLYVGAKNIDIEKKLYVIKIPVKVYHKNFLLCETLLAYIINIK